MTEKTPKKVYIIADYPLFSEMDGFMWARTMFESCKDDGIIDDYHVICVAVGEPFGLQLVSFIIETTLPEATKNQQEAEDFAHTLLNWMANDEDVSIRFIAEKFKTGAFV